MGTGARRVYLLLGSRTLRDWRQRYHTPTHCEEQRYVSTYVIQGRRGKASNRDGWQAAAQGELRKGARWVNHAYTLFLALTPWQALVVI